MAGQSITLSVIVVNYKNSDATIRCLTSIYKSKPKINFEIILVDNSGDFPKNKLSKIYKFKYIKSEKNLGYGMGNNLGSKYAKGKYILFLNSDTEVLKGALEELLKYLTKHKIAVIAPILLDKNKKPYQQGSKQLGFIEGIVSLSFINSIFPNNLISRKYFISKWNKKSVAEVDVVPGTALSISKELFSKVGGFDDRFFLYFEEFDICRRLKKLHCRFFIIPSAKVIHYFGQSSSESDFENYFKKSRFLYFKKHEGAVKALIVETFARFNKYSAALLLILLCSFALRAYNLDKQMIFIGDQGWFYLSARDIFYKHSLPLVGIASSHPWLHQGPFWTYILAIGLIIGNFNPLGGGYLAVIIDSLTVVALYFLGSIVSGRRVGLGAAMLYAASPLAIFYSRMPYHTTPIPFFVAILLYSLVGWIKGNKNYIPISFFLLGVLYNLELFSVVILVLVIFLLHIGRDRKIDIKKSATLFIIPMLPVLIYDIGHGFNQTLKFAGWIGYKAVTFNPFHLRGNDTSIFLINNLEKLIFPQSKFISLTMLTAAIFLLLVRKKRKELVFIGYLLIILIAILASGVSSQAYTFFLFPVVPIIISLFFNHLLKNYMFYCALFAIALLNVFYTVSGNYSLGIKQTTLEDRLKASKEIINIAKFKPYNLTGGGPGSEFSNFTANYKYLTWWLGHESSESNQALKIVVFEDRSGVKIFKK